MHYELQHQLILAPQIQLWCWQCAPHKCLYYYYYDNNVHFWPAFATSW